MSVYVCVCACVSECVSVCVCVCVWGGGAVLTMFTCRTHLPVTIRLSGKPTDRARLCISGEKCSLCNSLSADNDSDSRYSGTPLNGHP